MPQTLSTDSSRATEKIVWGLSLKIVQNDTIYMKHFVDFGGVQNCQSGCYRSVPVMAPTKGGVRQEAEQLILRQQRAGSR
jgi:uncharacterized protein YneR